MLQQLDSLYRQKPSIITGADGFIGKHLVAYFKQRDWPVLPLGRAAADLTERAQVLNLFKDLPQAGRLFHLATFQRTGNIQYAIPADLLTINTRIHLNVLEAWAEHQREAKLVAASSSCAYPVMLDPIPETAFQSGSLHEAVRGYGLAKQVLVRGAETYATQYKLKSLCCVFATVYGPQDYVAAERSHFVGGMMARALADHAAGKKEMLVYGTPQTQREVLYVTDQIAAMLAADAAFDQGIVNCAANQPITLLEMAQAMQTVIGWDAPIVFPPSTATGPDRKQLDSGLFLEKTGWRPRVALLDGLMQLKQDLQKRLPQA